MAARGDEEMPLGSVEPGAEKVAGAAAKPSQSPQHRRPLHHTPGNDSTVKILNRCSVTDYGPGHDWGQRNFWKGRQSCSSHCRWTSPTHKGCRPKVTQHRAGTQIGTG